MTAITPTPGLLTMLSTDGAVSRAGDSEDADSSRVEQHDSFLTLLQQATAVLPQALQVIRSEFPGASLGAESVSSQGDADAQPGALLTQLGTVFSAPGGLPVTAGEMKTREHQSAMLSADSTRVWTAKLDPSSAMAAGSLIEAPLAAVDGSELLVGWQSASSTGGHTADSLASPHRPIHVPVGNQGWAEEVGARLTMLGTRGEQSASLRLSPEHLGPLEVRITIQDDKASVWFGAAHAQTREAIEQALPRLREMLHSQGLELSDAGVFDESSPRETPDRHVGNQAVQVDPSEAPLQTLLHRGLLDLYV